MPVSRLKTTLGILSVAALGACGGGGGGGGDDPVAPQMVSGIFVDAPVQGLRWESKELSGVTDAAGTYQYLDGDPVKFSIGDIYLGESTGYTVIIPVDIVPGADNIDNATVLNIARMILTLDDDADSSNGIEITQVVSDLTAGESVNFNVSTEAFTNDGDVQVLVARLTAATAAGPRPLVTAAFARAHLENTIKNLLAGTYSGTYSGDANGTWTGTVTTDGQFTGTAQLSSGGEPIQMVGPVTTNGSGKAGFDASGGALGDRVITFTGIFRTDGNASGSWKDEDEGDSGKWSGSKNQ
jgi:para-nitrobenzyl esterase